MKLLGAPATQIVGKLNILIMAMFASVFLEERVDSGEIFGGGIVLFGIYIFERFTRPGSVPPTGQPGRLDVESSGADGAGSALKLNSIPTSRPKNDNNSHGDISGPQVFGLPATSRAP